MPGLIAAVEQLSGRSTIAFLLENSVDPDLAVESFVLAPRADRPLPDSDRGIGVEVRTTRRAETRGAPADPKLAPPHRAEASARF